MEYIKQYHVEQDPDEIKFHWSFNFFCNYSCSYCHATPNMDGSLTSFSNQKKIVDNLSQVKNKFILIVEGGEPTASPMFLKTCDYMSNKIISKGNRVIITTNASMALSFWDKVKSDGINWLLSYHPEEADNNHFIDVAKLLTQKGLKVKINLTLHPNRKYWDKTKELYVKLSELGIRVHPQFLYFSADEPILFRYNDEFYRFFKFIEEFQYKELQFDTTEESILVNDYDVYKKQMNKFKGWDCYNNNFEIDSKGNIWSVCNKQFKTFNIIKELSFFSEKFNTKPITCPFETCNCDGQMKQLKINNVNRK